MSDKLKPCPVCGGFVEIIGHPVECRTAWAWACISPGCYYHKTGMETEKAAIRMHNSNRNPLYEQEREKRQELIVRLTEYLAAVPAYYRCNFQEVIEMIKEFGVEE